MARRRDGGRGRGEPDVRSALADHLVSRLELHAAVGGLRRVTATGGVTVYPAASWAAALRAGRPVTLPAFYVTAACRAAGLPSPLPPNPAPAWVTVGADGAVTPL